jgi:hypothetical protein
VPVIGSVLEMEIATVPQMAVVNAHIAVAQRAGAGGTVEAGRRA